MKQWQITETDTNQFKNSFSYGISMFMLIGQWPCVCTSTSLYLMFVGLFLIFLVFFVINFVASTDKEKSGKQFEEFFSLDFSTSFFFLFHLFVSWFCGPVYVLLWHSDSFFPFMWKYIMLVKHISFFRWTIFMVKQKLTEERIPLKLMKEKNLKIFPV